MIAYVCVVLIIVAIVVCVRTFLYPFKGEKPIPLELKEDDMFWDGNRLMYVFDGHVYEAISRHDDVVYVYDDKAQKIVKVPYIKGE